MPDATKWRQVSEPATPVETRVPGYDQLSRGSHIASDWWGGEQPSLEDLARRIDEDRAAVLADMEASDIAALSLHEILAAIGEALGCDGPASGDTLVARAVELKRSEIERDEARAISDTLYAREQVLRAALLATRDHDEPDGPCWCRAFSIGMGQTARLRSGHGEVCLQTRAALGIEQTTEPTP